MAVVRLKRPAIAAADAAEGRESLPLSVTRPEILIDGTDREFRRLIHRMLIGQARLDAIRESIAARIGVSGTQYTMLMSVLHLQGTVGVSIGALADYLEVTGPHVTALIGKLVASGFVRKAANPNDGRGVLVKLTPVGRKKLLQAFEFIAAVNDRLFDGVGREEYRAVAGFHAKFMHNTQATLDWIGRRPGGLDRSSTDDV
jgi:MarR family transcriptional regulator, organic hydroperoxide resistance regulator